MNRTAYRLHLLYLSTAIAAVSTALLLYACLAGGRGVLFYCPNLRIVLAGNVALFVCLCIITYRKHCEFRHAQLIRESNLLPAPQNGGKEEDWAVYLSPFGLLIEDCIVPFDVANTTLTGVRLGADSIVIDYRKNGCERSLALPRAVLGDTDLKTFENNLKHETGVALTLPE